MLATSEQAPGRNVQTTINPDLQEATVSALGGRSGGAVVLDARTGDVRALAGQAYSFLRPPGSTFKVITATAGLEEGKVKLDDTFEPVTEINPAPDTGARVIENAHDELCGGTFEETFAESCNTVFAPLGVEVGEEKLVETAERFGFNQEPTLYNAEATEAADPQPMDMPTTYDETGTELSVSAIGQGTVLATPLGMASVAQTIANGGRALADLDRQRPRAAVGRRAGPGDLEGERQGDDVADGGGRRLRDGDRGRAARHPGRGQDRHRRARARSRTSRRPGRWRPARSPPTPSRSSTPGSSRSPRRGSRSWRSP